MAFEADLIADRRKLRRKLSLWRVLAIGSVFIGILAIGLAAGGMGLINGSRQHVARIAVKGFISGDAASLKLYETLGDDKRVSAVLVTIDSPGGSTTGAEALYEGLRRLSAKKPTVAVIGSMAASGGYIAAMATDHIVARETALVGSIGVLVQYPNLVKLLDSIGVRMEEVKSAPLKASPNPFEVTTPEARAALQSLVADSYDWFKRLVRERRTLNDAELTAVADGRVHTGRQAKGLKLIDEIGGEREAIAWLVKEKNIKADLPVQDRSPVRTSDGLRLWSVAEESARIVGLPGLATTLGRIGEASEIARLDGLLAIWHPSLGKVSTDQ
jgi:protease IV